MPDPSVLPFGNGPKQRLDTIPTDLGHDPEFREVCPDRIDQCRSLTHKHLTGSVQRVTASQMASASAASFFWFFT